MRGRLLAQDVIRVGAVVVVVSTWFTVIDLGIAANGRPLLWQTIVSDHAMHADIGQYSSREQAARGRAQAVAMISGRLRGLVARAALDEVRPEPTTDPTPRVPHDTGRDPGPPSA